MQEQDQVFKFELKEKVKDTITSFTGVVAARIQWMNGCVRYVVLSNKRTNEGKEIEATIDEQQLVSLAKPKVKVTHKPGGPFRAIPACSSSHLKR